ncbi:MAG: DUF1232 domain-containing protein [Dehalococcoidia bacterium]|nr:MAG: DUF1232 domain-containing protein [Dehalococcoidia bacterium]
MVEILIGVAAGLVALLVVLTVLLWFSARRQPETAKQVVKRLLKLSLRAKLKLAWRLLGDARVPLWVKTIVPLLILYLAMPLDIVPDFLPVVGHLDDLMVLVVGVSLFVRFTPLAILEEHLMTLERAHDKGAPP